MRIDFVGYAWRFYDGYGRYCCALVKALQKAGHDVRPVFSESVNAPWWIKEQMGIARDTFTISCLPACYLQDAPSGGRHWLITMTEGSELPVQPDDWAAIINGRDIERVIVPCEHNRLAFVNGGVKAPVHVIPGGVDPDEFPLVTSYRIDAGVLREYGSYFYNFLALADRGARKGWTEVYAAFYKAFGTPQDTPDVRLIIKSRPDSNDLLDLISRAENLDPRLSIWQEDAIGMRDVYAQVDCVVLPSRSEGWGMPHREAAMMGLPVITQCYSGMDDGHTDAWAIVVDGGRLEPIPTQFDHIKGEWMRCNVDELAKEMYWCYMNPTKAAASGLFAHHWLNNNQTWEHSAKILLDLIQEYS